MQNIQQAIQNEIEAQVTRQTRQMHQNDRQLFVKMKLDLAKCKKEISALKKELGFIHESFAEGMAPKPERPRIPRVTARNIVQLRQRFELTETELAKLLNVSLVTISRWEHGKHCIRSSTKLKIAEFRKMGKRAIKRRLAKMP